MINGEICPIMESFRDICLFKSKSAVIGQKCAFNGAPVYTTLCYD